MSAKAIREYDGKSLLSYWLPKLSSPSSPSSPTDVTSTTILDFLPPTHMASLIFNSSLLSAPQNGSDTPADQAARQHQFNAHMESVFAQTESAHPWLLTKKLVVKPDQLIKRRGKSGLLGLNLDWSSVKDWIRARAGKEVQVRKYFYISYFIIIVIIIIIFSLIDVVLNCVKSKFYAIYLLVISFH